MRGEIFDIIPGGGPAFERGLIGPQGQMSRLHKGAKAPPQPPPPPAVPDIDEAGAAEMEKRRQQQKDGLQDTQEGTLLSGARRGSLGQSSFQAGKVNPKPSLASNAGAFFKRGGEP